MIELCDLSRIGFGAYRVSLSAAHYEALLYALSLGCNLIDTAATYTGGESEQLIGRVLANNPQLRAFIVTKAGYIATRAAASRDCDGQKEATTRPTGTCAHSIHPDYLKAQIEESCRRLRRPWLDGFLLHNPEYYFASTRQDSCDTEYYVNIRKAFELCEEYAAKGVIRYYGISSNTFPYSTAERGTTNLATVLQCAQEVCVNHHFKLIEFPFNLFETGAVTAHHNGDSLITLARRHGIITLGNRPLNALYGGKQIRLATYDRNDSDKKMPSNLPWKQCLDLITNQLDAIGVRGGPDQFDILALLTNHWSSLETPDAVTSAFQNLFSLLHRLFGSSVPEKLLALIGDYHDVVMHHARNTTSEKARAVRAAFVSDRILDSNDDRPFAVAACERYLKSGIGHVLVGMRRKEYVDDLKSLFTPLAQPVEASSGGLQ